MPVGTRRVLLGLVGARERPGGVLALTDFRPVESGQEPPVAVRVGLVGVGNCALALCRALQHLEIDHRDDSMGPGCFPSKTIAGLRPHDIEIVCAFDIDSRKIGRSLAEALAAPPNDVSWRSSIPLDATRFSCEVVCGPILDGAPKHLKRQGSLVHYQPYSDRLAPQSVRRVLSETHPEVLILYLPTGSTRAAAFYAIESLNCSSALLNSTPANLACSRMWASRFARAELPIIGDDVKSQFGTTAVHEALAAALYSRGATELRTYQLNAGGNADHLNLAEPARQKHKALTKGAPLRRLAADMMIGPIANAYLPWAKDHKRSHVHVRAQGLLGHTITIDVLLEVDDSPNSAAVILDAVRHAAVARRLGRGGALHGGAETMMKRVPDHGIGFDL